MVHSIHTFADEVGVELVQSMAQCLFVNFRINLIHQILTYFYEFLFLSAKCFLKLILLGMKDLHLLSLPLGNNNLFMELVFDIGDEWKELSFNEMECMVLIAGLSLAIFIVGDLMAKVIEVTEHHLHPE